MRRTYTSCQGSATQRRGCFIGIMSLVIAFPVAVFDARTAKKQVSRQSSAS